MREIESTFSIMFPNDSLHTQLIISLLVSLFSNELYHRELRMTRSSIV